MFFYHCQEIFHKFSKKIQIFFFSSRHQPKNRSIFAKKQSLHPQGQIKNAAPAEKKILGGGGVLSVN